MSLSCNNQLKTKNTRTSLVPIKLNQLELNQHHRRWPFLRQALWKSSQFVFVWIESVCFLLPFISFSFTSCFIFKRILSSRSVTFASCVWPASVLCLVNHPTVLPSTPGCDQPLLTLYIYAHVSVVLHRIVRCPLLWLPCERMTSARSRFLPFSLHPNTKCKTKAKMF